MGLFRSLCVLVAMALVGSACKAPAAGAAEPPAEAPKEGHDGKPEAQEGDAGAPHAPHAAHAPHKFSVPFASEFDRDDPLAQTRGYFQQIFGDNAAYMRTHEPTFFRAFAGAQKPRATVVTCSDSRVQSTAFDATPENDDFFVRNIGNQIATSEGSVEYGVEHLKTPVLLILGHTGCGAVKAAMGDTSKESAALRKELDPLKVQKSARADEPAVWAEAVVGNVHDQVAFALERFSEEVSSGQLTIVGAVYDFRNDMRQGAGKVNLVDVNGNREPAKIAAFERGVLGIVAPPQDAHGADAGAREGVRAREAREAREPGELKEPKDGAREPKDAKEGREAREAKDATADVRTVLAAADELARHRASAQQRKPVE